MKNEILISNNLIQVNAPANVSEKADMALVGTLIANFVSYGYALSESVLKTLQSYSATELKSFWKDVKPALDVITGKDRNMEAFVVYKNFPEEVLAMSDAQYWIAQILMYVGVKNEYFTEEVKVRDPLFEKVSLKVLSPADEKSLSLILEGYVANTSRWSDNQSKYAEWLIANVKMSNGIDLSSFGFKENGIKAIKQGISLSVPVTINDATDVLRLAAALSDADLSLRTNVKFKNFSKTERRILLGVLENTKNLEDDMAMKKTLWKKFLARLHPGDFKFKRVKAAYDALYNNEIKSFNGLVESAINEIHDRTPNPFNLDLEKNKSYSLNDLKKVVNTAKKENINLIVIPEDYELLKIVAAKPGDMLRRFHKLYSLFGNQAVLAITSVIEKFTTIQLLKFMKYVETINDRKELIVAPSGNWTKAQIIKNEKAKILEDDKNVLILAINKELAKRMNVLFPKGVAVDDKTKEIKIQTNDQELAEYGRGTSFDIPENIKFFRSASYWKQISHGNTWFDNGWNFFNDDWKAMGTCCWNVTKFGSNGQFGAVFSGDPTNSKDMEGRACQMIDLYLDKLSKMGVRYAVWNVLAFSTIPFSAAEDVLATLQMGEEAMEGGLYEPSRAQMVFPLKGDNLTKYIAYIDVKERKLVYMDANLYGNVRSAQSNESVLEEKMPAFIEYLKTIPSVYDVVSHAKKGIIPVVYTDKDVEITENEAYVFKPENSKNEFKKININAIIG